MVAPQHHLMTRWMLRPSPAHQQVPFRRRVNLTNDTTFDLYGTN